MLGFCEFAEAFMMTNCLLRIPPSPCKQGEAWLRHLKLVRIRPAFFETNLLLPLLTQRSGASPIPTVALR